MKKIVVTILAIIYLTASTGASVNIHYCMGKLVDWTLNGADNELCDYCGMSKTDTTEGCCQDDHKFIKNSDDHKIASSVQLIFLSPSHLPSSFNYNPEHIFASLAEEHTKVNDPPQGRSIPVFLRNRVFLI